MCPENSPYPQRSPSNVLIRRPSFFLCSSSHLVARLCMCVQLDAWRWYYGSAQRLPLLPPRVGPISTHEMFLLTVAALLFPKTVGMVLDDDYGVWSYVR